MIKKIYLDMDGVLADFNGHFRNLFGEDPGMYEETHGTTLFWEKIYENPSFFRDLPMFDYTPALIRHCENIAEDVVILSAPSRVNTPLCMIQKREWIDKHISRHFPAIFESSKEKYAGPGRLLIDDTYKKIVRWQDNGGDGHLFIGIEDCLVFLNSEYIKSER